MDVAYGSGSRDDGLRCLGREDNPELRSDKDRLLYDGGDQCESIVVVQGFCHAVVEKNR